MSAGVALHAHPPTTLEPPRPRPRQRHARRVDADVDDATRREARHHRPQAGGIFDPALLDDDGVTIAAVTGTITWNTGETWTGSLLINDAAATATTDDLVKATISFVGTGTWTV